MPVVINVKGGAGHEKNSAHARDTIPGAHAENSHNAPRPASGIERGHPGAASRNCDRGPFAQQSQCQARRLFWRETINHRTCWPSSESRFVYLRRSYEAGARRGMSQEEHAWGDSVSAGYTNGGGGSDLGSFALGASFKPSIMNLLSLRRTEEDHASRKAF